MAKHIIVNDASSTLLLRPCLVPLPKRNARGLRDGARAPKFADIPIRSDPPSPVIVFVEKQLHFIAVDWLEH